MQDGNAIRVIVGILVAVVVLAAIPGAVPIAVLIYFVMGADRRRRLKEKLFPAAKTDMDQWRERMQDLQNQSTARRPQDVRHSAPPRQSMQRPQQNAPGQRPQAGDSRYQPVDDNYDSFTEGFQESFYREKERGREVNPWELPPEKAPWEK